MLPIGKLFLLLYLSLMRQSYIIFAFLAIFFAASCANDDDGGDIATIPQQQVVVTNDSTGLTGELTVKVRYLENNTLFNATSGTIVQLFNTYEDLVNNLPIYDLGTAADSAYFGFINYGNYYVRAENTYGGVLYIGDAAVQVRPSRYEILTLTMFP